MNSDREIEYIASRYKEGRFKVEPALKRIIGKRFFVLRFRRVAAACIVGVALAATATVIITDYINQRSVDRHAVGAAPADPVTEVSKVIDFEDATLPEVVAKIKEVYGVEISNLPGHAATCRLSLHYEGTAENLVDIINETLDIQLKIKTE